MAGCDFSDTNGEKDNTRARAWTFTIDKYNDVPASLSASMRYLIVGEEVSPDGTAQLQGYVVFKNPAMSPHKHFLRYGRGTFRKASGDPDENVERCKRGDKYREFEGPGGRPRNPKAHGHHGREGRESRESRESHESRESREWERSWQLAKRGRIEEISAEKRVKHLSTWLKVQSNFGAKLDCIDKLDNLWIHGPSGSGKSRWVNLTYPHCYRKLNSKWWDGYSVVDPKHKVVLCEDLHPDTWPKLPQLKVWADHYPFIAETKGSSLTIRPERIIVTANYTPEQCFARREDVEAILRRFRVQPVEHLPPPPPRMDWEAERQQEIEEEMSEVGSRTSETHPSCPRAGHDDEL